MPDTQPVDPPPAAAPSAASSHRVPPRLGPGDRVAIAAPAAEGCLLLLEETGEQPYRLDRILTQLTRAGVLGRAAGLVLGDFTDCGPADQVQAVLADRLGGLGIPVATGLPAGHGPLQLTVPLGSLAQLRAGPSGTTLTLLETPLAPRQLPPRQEDLPCAC
ncbi:hypothetical protein [Kitasatospora azatica]|uniref:hypothetical protein n=1 Tax=Kitasatospora azatica TaxID=58347 RepID=UPI00068FECFC|nr:hypothetical protein [Kitasatospora azatica]